MHRPMGQYGHPGIVPNAWFAAEAGVQAFRGEKTGCVRVFATGSPLVTVAPTWVFAAPGRINPLDFFTFPFLPERSEGSQRK